MYNRVKKYLVRPEKKGKIIEELKTKVSPKVLKTFLDAMDDGRPKSYSIWLKYLDYDLLDECLICVDEDEDNEIDFSNIGI